jgi:D-3-phosphoglycerate dehydrogenase
MEKSRLVLLIAESNGFSSKAVSILSKNFEVRLEDLNRAQLLLRLRDVEVLWVRLRNKIDKELLEHAPRLRTIVTNTTGLNHIDCQAASDRGIRVLSLRGETCFLRDIRATAEHTIGLILSLLRYIPTAFESVRSGKWDRYGFQGNEIFGSTVGIIGFGRLGYRVAVYARNFGANVLVFDPHRHCEKNEDFVSRVDLDQLLEESDIVSLHADYRESNFGMLNCTHFSKMKPSSVFINTARGELVDETALLIALENRKIRGAALDVLTDENSLDFSANPLLQYAKKHDNLLLTPHIGGYTRESLERTEEFMASKVVREMATLDA